MAARTRRNGEGSIFPYRNGFAAYVWVTKPDGTRTRKYVYGTTRQDVHDKWVDLQAKARRGPVVSKIPRLDHYLVYWLREVVEPSKAPATFAKYETLARLYIIPALGDKRLDRLQVRDVQTWLNGLPKICQCCTQGKDEARAKVKRRCCSLGKCCGDYPSASTIATIRNCLRAVLTYARDTDEYVSRNVAELAQLPALRARKGKAWSTDEARQFLESARSAGDPFYAAYVLVLVLGMRKGEVLGLAWDEVDLAAPELLVGWQLQRVGRQLLRREVKTEASEAPLPLPGLCVSAFKLRRAEQESDRATAVANSTRLWQNRHNLVFTTRYGTAVEPRNFSRSWEYRCEQADVRKITVHDARRTCATLLVDLDVHPRVIMSILRHAQISVTMKVYAQAPSAQTREALKRLGDSLG